MKTLFNFYQISCNFMRHSSASGEKFGFAASVITRYVTSHTVPDSDLEMDIGDGPASPASPVSPVRKEEESGDQEMDLYPLYCVWCFVCTEYNREST